MSDNQHPLEVDCDEVKARIATDDVLLLDCREQEEFDVVHIPGAMLLPMSQLQVRVDELAAFREKEIVVLCHHGIRSLDVATWLHKQGFASVKSLAGGIDRWAQQIDPTLPRY